MADSSSVIGNFMKIQTNLNKFIEKIMTKFKTPLLIGSFVFPLSFTPMVLGSDYITNGLTNQIKVSSSILQENTEYLTPQQSAFAKKHWSEMEKWFLAKIKYLQGQKLKELNSINSYVQAYKSIPYLPEKLEDVSYGVPLSNRTNQVSKLIALMGTNFATVEEIATALDKVGPNNILPTFEKNLQLYVKKRLELIEQDIALCNRLIKNGFSKEAMFVAFGNFDRKNVPSFAKDLEREIFTNPQLLREYKDFAYKDIQKLTKNQVKDNFWTSSFFTNQLEALLVEKKFILTNQKHLWTDEYAKNWNKKYLEYKEVIDKNRIATLAGTSTIASAKIRHVEKLIKNLEKIYQQEKPSIPNQAQSSLNSKLSDFEKLKLEHLPDKTNNQEFKIK